MSSARQSCLFVMSSAVEGVSAQSFMQAFGLAQTAFNVQLASPSGGAVEYVLQDENSRRWMSEFRTKSYAKPISFQAVEASHYAALFFPNSPGAVRDLARNTELANIVSHFLHAKKPICAVGIGVAGLFCATENNSWKFKAFSMTSASVFELARTSYFSNLPIIPEDFIKEHGARFSSSECDAVHCVIDRHLITGQNDQSTLIAVQNLILFCTQRPATKLSTSGL
jgi:putative intracellular protease/amidase